MGIEERSAVSLDGISIVCFSASYGVALALELTRLVFRSGIRGALMLGFAAAGLVAHSLFLTARVVSYRDTSVYGWFDWYLLVAWLLTANSVDTVYFL